MKKLELNGRTILVTGAAGFIGANLVLRLLRECRGTRIVGLDTVNDYYDVSVKEYRLRQIAEAAAASAPHPRQRKTDARRRMPQTPLPLPECLSSDYGKQNCGW